MSNTLGRFEILSELARSANGAVYKANDPESGQTVALKTLDLTKLGEQGPEMVKRVLEEGETTKTLNSHNLAALYGAGDIGDQFCASLEYVQGNSIATMLARKEGFSIWDLQDIARQTCQGLDHAHTKGVFHYSLEPAKIMVTWDGTVKILGFGISTMGAFASQSAGPAPLVLHYMSPEQLHGDPLDARSNLFSLGAILYEMVTERKAFDGENAEQVRQQILEGNPVSPLQINRKMHPALNDVIMKALSKSPEERYQSGQDLVNDLEKCKESPAKAAAAQKAAQSAQGLNTPQPPKPAPPVASKLVATPPKPAAPVMQKPAAEKPAWPASHEEKPSPQVTLRNDIQAKPPQAPVQPPPATKAFAAAASFGATSTDLKHASRIESAPSFEISATKPLSGGMVEEQANMSAAVIEPEPVTEPPKIHVDPMMAEPNENSAGKSLSFADVDELPPLKEVYVAPAPPPPAASEQPTPVPAATMFRPPAPEKPKVLPREVAKKAVTEIKKTPPKLFAYSIAAAVGVILLIIVAIAFHIRSENMDDDNAPEQTAAVQPVAPTPAPGPPAQPATTTPVPAQQLAPAPPIEQTPAVSVKPRYSPRRKREKAQPPAPTVVPGQLTVNSTPTGAQLQFDGRTDATWVTPYNMTGLNPGQHMVTISKPGFSSETRTIEVGPGSKSFLVVQLAALTATLSVTSTPSGAEVYLDGKNTGHATPTQMSVDKPGIHTVTVRKQGFLEEITTANLQTGQTFHYSPALRALGNTDEIKTVSRFKKVFGGGDAAGMGVVSIKTNPKGAQIAVNRRMVDKLTPLEFYLNPGNYVIDITASGYKDIRRVISVDKGGKVAIEEIMQRE
jgi:serine/threonine protein kinase